MATLRIYQAPSGQWAGQLLDEDGTELAGVAGCAAAEDVGAQNKDRRHLPLSAWALIEVSLREWKPSHRPDKGELSSPLRASNQEMADAVGVTKKEEAPGRTTHTTRRWPGPTGW